MKNSKEKPKYGWYVGNVLIFIGILGIFGLILFIWGYLINFPLNLIFWITGFSLVIIFLWPTLGFIIMNITLNFWIPKPSIRFAFLKDFTSPTILDCGCGTGRHAIQIAKQLPSDGSLTGIDIYNTVAISGNSLQRVRKNAELEGITEKTDFQVGSITAIPFEDQSFDIISVGSVMHEIHNNSDKEKAFNELFRVLKNNGLLYFGEWNRNSWQLILFAGIFTLVFKPQEFWIRQLQNHRFIIIKTENYSGFIEFFAKKNKDYL